VEAHGHGLRGCERHVLKTCLFYKGPGARADECGTRACEAAVF
jgi:hypothetical protein